jgi:hypothetical protein
MNTIRNHSIARSLVLAAALGPQAVLALGCGAGAGGDGAGGDEGKSDVAAPEKTGKARAADTTYPVLDNVVMLSNGGGVWSNSDNTNGPCGLFRNFVIAGSDPTGTILNPTGTWSDGLGQTLTSGHHIFTSVGALDVAGGWTTQIWFSGGANISLDNNSPTGKITVGSVEVFASAYVYPSSLDLVSACTVGPDGYTDGIGYIVLTVPY